MRDIRVLIAKCPADFNEENIEFSFYTDASQRRQPMCFLAQAAFTLLGAGYVGKKAFPAKLECFDGSQAENALTIATEPRETKDQAAAEISLPADAVFQKDGQPVTTSLKVAQYFRKEHKAVLLAIRGLLADCPEEFGRNNFIPSSYANSQGKTQPMYYLTGDAFGLLPLGPADAKTVAVKLAYTKAFQSPLIQRGVQRPSMSKKQEKKIPGAPAEATMPADAVFQKDGEPVTTSLKVAEYFGKRHDNVLASIDRLIAECPHEFGLVITPPAKLGA